MDNSGLILAFHQVANRFYPGINTIRPGYFFALIELIQSWGFVLNGGEDAPKTAVLTFDDGYADIHEPVLALCEMGIHPFIFIPTDCIGKRNRWDWSSRFFRSEHLNEAQIRQLHNSGAIIGSHGQTHSALTLLDDKMLVTELTDSKKRLEDVTGARVTDISFPFGRHNGRVVHACRGAGFNNFYALGAISHDCLGFLDLHRRIAIYSCDTYYSLRSKLTAKGRIETIKNTIINRLAGGTIIISHPSNKSQ